MSTKSIIAAIVGAIVAFLAGWVIWGMLLMDFYQAHTTQYEGLYKEPMNLAGIFVSQLAWGFLLAYLLEKMSVNTFAGGFLHGAIIFFLITLAFDVFMYSSMNLMDTTIIAVDVIVNAIFGGIIGGVIAMMLGRGKTVVAA
jgi:hypothetical protein